MEVAACPPHEFNKSVNKYAIIMYIVSYSFVSVVVFYLLNVRKVYDSLHIRCLSIYLSLSLCHTWAQCIGGAFIDCGKLYTGWFRFARMLSTFTLL